MATSAMEAALSIISLVIFAAPCACACAHNTPGSSVPARPIPEHAFIKFRRSSILILSFVQPRGRARKIAHHVIDRFAAFFPRKCSEPEQRRWPSFLFSGTKLNVVRFPHPQRSFHDPIQKVFHFPAARASELPSPASPCRQSRQPARGGQRGCPQGRRHFSKDFPGTRFFPRPKCPGAVPQQRWRSLR